MKALAEVKVNKPVLTDTINVRGIKPDMNRLMLEYKVPLNGKKRLHLHGSRHRRSVPPYKVWLLEEQLVGT